MSRNLRKQLIPLLKKLHLPVFRQLHEEYARKATQEGLSYEQYLFELAQAECEVRQANKVARLVKASQLPMEKTLDNFNLKRLPLRIRQQVKMLLDGTFINRNLTIVLSVEISCLFAGNLCHR